MVNDDAKLQAGLFIANAVVHEVKDYVDELEKQRQSNFEGASDRRSLSIIYLCN